MRGSLKKRLLALSLATVVVVWVGASAITYYDAREEFNDILDAHLAQSATLLVVQATHDNDEIETEHAPLLHKYSRRVAFQIWEGGRILRLHSGNAPTLHLSKSAQGFSDSVIDGVRWRVFSTWDESGSNLIQVAELADARDELTAGIIDNLLKPLLISLPLLALLLWIAVSRGLRPLDRLTAQVEQRAPDNLAPLDTRSVPDEVAPLVERLNRLFARMDSSLQKERRFTADAAHELRTPVAGIKAQVQVARASENIKARVHALDQAIVGCDRATHLIEQLLMLARIDNLSGDISESCSLSSIAAGVIAEIAPMALRQDIRLELIGDELTVDGNPLLLRVLLRNLIDNAVRHTSAGTIVQVHIDEEQGQVSVNDNGPGIPEAERSRVLERFYRPVDTIASGSGLGLSIVARIAEIHHAVLDISPGDEGVGLSATVRFATQSCPQLM
jgi:two-component system sensor histidine kinase QseC